MYGGVVTKRKYVLLKTSFHRIALLSTEQITRTGHGCNYGTLLGCSTKLLVILCKLYRPFQIHYVVDGFMSTKYSCQMGETKY